MFSYGNLFKKEISFPVRLMGLRTQHGLTQKQLAIKAGVDQTSISNWESGKYTPHLINFVALADVFGCDPFILRDGQPEFLSAPGFTAGIAQEQPAAVFESRAPKLSEFNFDAIISEQITLCEAMLIQKGKEYSKKNDRLRSFNRAAALQGVTPREALAGMMAKHTYSVYDLCHTGSDSLELWTEKITDHINYLLLLKAVVVNELAQREEVKK